MKASDDKPQNPKAATLRGSVRRRKKKNASKKDQGSPRWDNKQSWDVEEDAEASTSAQGTGFNPQPEDNEPVESLFLRGGLGPGQHGFIPGREPSSYSRTNIYESLPDLESGNETEGSGTQASGIAVTEAGPSRQETETPRPRTEPSARAGESRPFGAGPDEVPQEGEAVLPEAQVSSAAGENNENGLSIFMCVPQKRQTNTVVQVSVDTVDSDKAFVEAITEKYNKKRDWLVGILTVKTVCVAQVWLCF